MEMAVVDDDELCDHPDPTSLSRSLPPLPPSLTLSPPPLTLPPSLSPSLSQRLEGLLPEDVDFVVVL